MPAVQEGARMFSSEMVLRGRSSCHAGLLLLLLSSHAYMLLLQARPCIAPHKPCAPGCTDIGVCNGELGRCDCPFQRTGERCELFVKAGNLPACGAEYGTNATSASCAKDMQPLWKCPNSCSGRGFCNKDRKCVCDEGVEGCACDVLTKPSTCLQSCNASRGWCMRGFCHCRPGYWGQDCSNPRALQLPEDIPRPRIYVYELPPEYTSHEFAPQWLHVLLMGKDQPGGLYHSDKLFHVDLLNSPHRVVDPEHADFFFIPVWDMQGGWGPFAVHDRALEYIRQTYPYWDRNNGADHMFVMHRDTGSSDDALHKNFDRAVMLTHWGHSHGLWGTKASRGYIPEHDIVISPAVSHDVINSPWMKPPAQRLPRKKELYFAGRICWDEPFQGKSLPAPEEVGPCTWGNYWQPYSFGIRKALWDLYRNATAFHIIDFGRQAVTPTQDLASMRQAVFCFAPSGMGWGIRTHLAVVQGCIPVIIQDDGKEASVRQAHEALVPWDELAVRLHSTDLSRLPEVLFNMTDAEIAAKQSAMERHWTRLVWRSALRLPAGVDLPGRDAFATILQDLERLRVQLRGQHPV